MILKTLIKFTFILVWSSCMNTKLVKTDTQKTEIVSDSIQITPYIFEICESSNTCEGLFDCYHKFLLSDQLFEYTTFNTARSYFNIDTLLDCTLHMYQNNKVKSDLAAQCLFSYYNKLYLKGIERGRGATPYRGIHHKILTNWNTVKSFDICIQFISFNVHDSMGHGDCTNLTIDFLFKIVYPKIKTIYDQEPDQFYINLTKHLDNEQNYADCFDSVYKIMYPTLKKAWEEGKIELKE